MRRGSGVECMLASLLRTLYILRQSKKIKPSAVCKTKPKALKGYIRDYNSF